MIIANGHRLANAALAAGLLMVWILSDAGCTDEAQVASALTVSPAGPVSIATHAAHGLTASGGTGPYTWSIAANLSGSRLSATSGAATTFTAGDTIGVTDAVRVTDSASATEVVSMIVGPAAVAQAFYGPGIAGDALDNHQVADVDVDYRFRAATTSALQKLIWYNVHTIHSCPPKSGATYGCGTGGTMHICIQTDDGSADHLATGHDLACTDSTNLMTAPTFPVETFQSPPALTQGQLYHIHWHNTDPNPTLNFVSVDAIFTYNATVPRQPTIPDDDMAVFRGTTLRASDTPIFQLEYADGTVQGQGYMEMWIGQTADISGRAKVRETFTVSGQDRVAKNVTVRLNRVDGSSPLTVTLETATGSVIEQGTIPSSSFTRSASASDANWATYAFSAPRTLASGQSYHLVLSTLPDTRYRTYGCERGNHYGFTAATFFGDGYGQLSTDDGVTWVGFSGAGRTDNKNADLQFHFGL
jgi:hypothetical protein